MSLPIAPAFADSRTFPVYGGIARSRRAQTTQVSSDIQAYLIGQISDDLAVIQPIQINIERDEDQTYVVSDDLFLVYGNGEVQAKAIHDYVASLIEFYRILEKSAATNKFDQEQFANIQAYIQPVPARGNDAIQTERD